MAEEQNKPVAADEPPTNKPKLALKDRISDLRLGARAGAVGSKFADRMKAVQAAAPTATEFKDKVKATAGAVRLDKLNRETLKAGRDGIAAKVEALLKPRPAADGDLTRRLAAAKSDLQSKPIAAGDEPKTQPADIAEMKARVEDALRRKAQSDSAQSSVPAAAAPTPPSTRSRLTQVTARLKTGVSHLTASRAQKTIAADATDATATMPSPSPVPRAVRTTTTTGAPTVLATDAAGRRPIFSVAMLLTAVTAGGVLHILTAFAIPAINTGSAFERLRWQLEPNTVQVFPADPEGKTPLPFLTADMRYAMCRYDLTNGPVQVSVTLADIGWSLALYTPQGDNFYAVPGQDGRVVTSAFTLNTASDRLLLPVPGVRRSDTDAAQVTSPQREGLLVVRAPNVGPAYRSILEDALKKVSCRAAPRR